MTKKLLIISLMLFGLAVGVVGVSAQEAVQSQPTAPPHLISSVDPSTIAEVNLRPGIRNPNVRKVQEAFKVMGYLPLDLETTEYLGPKTKEAIINFQRAQGLPTTGFFGPATRAALKKVLQESRAVIDKNVDIACMKTAVEKRENALLSAYDTYSQKLRTARETRETDLLVAWSIQDPKERHTAIKVAWEKYRQSVKTATTEWNQSRRTTWIQFAQDAKNCKASTVEAQDLENVEAAE
jgi:peptidoglycan hydrolase-like protein with peptidoglycan-binding domain